MSDEVLIAELWRRLGPLLPPRPRRFRYPGRHAVNDWVVLAGIVWVVWVLRHDVRWRQLPTSFGVSAVTCAVTCWRRLRDWQAAGVWQKLHEALLADLHAAGRLDLHAAIVDSSPCARSQRGEATGPSPVNRGHAGSKHHLIIDRRGVPLAVIVTAGNRHDITQLTPLVEGIPPIRGRRGRPKRRPRYLLADRGYDHSAYRRQREY